MRELHAVSRLFPPLTEEEYAALRTSIDENGVLVAITVDADGKIVDGRHRARAAEELGLEPEYEPLAEGMDPWTYARTVNLDRRHLTAQQRVAVLKQAEMKGEAPEVDRIREQAKERQSPGRGGIEPQERLDSGKAEDKVGALVGVSGDTVRRVEDAVATAEKVGDDPATLVEKIASGETTAQEYVKKTNVELGAKVRGLAGPETPVYDAWWKAIGILTNRVKLDGLEEEWSGEQRAKIEEWTPIAIARLEKVFARLEDQPRLRGINGGSNG